MPGSTSSWLCRKLDPMPLITFEGSEGCGKSTQAKRLAAYLEKQGAAATVLREPGSTLIGEAIRHLLQHSEENVGMTPETELLLFEASRSQLVCEKIQPALARDEWVICDRFYDSTTVYQGAARRLDMSFVKQLNEFAAGGCVPDVTFILDLDRAAAQRRLDHRKIRDRMEEQPEEFYQRVRAAYRDLAKEEPERIVVIDGALAADEIEAKIRDVIFDRFPSSTRKSAIENQK
jgi:dTMP kinase